MGSSRVIRLKPGLRASEKVFRRILIAVDGSESSSRAAKTAVRLAKRNEAELIVVSVVPRPTYTFTPTPTPFVSQPSWENEFPRFPGRPTIGLSDYYAYASRAAERWADEVVLLAKRQDVKVTKRVFKGAASVVETITNYSAAQKVDLIVLGTKGSGGFKRLLLGSVSSGVVNHAASSVLVVR